MSINVEGGDVDRRLRAALERTSDHVVLLDREFRVLYVNPRVNELNGVRPGHYLGLTHWEAWPSSVGTDVEHALRRALETQENAHLEHNHAEKGGLDLWMEIDAVPSEDGLAIFFRDVTRRRLAEDLLWATADAVTSLVAYVDASLCYRFVNRRYEEWFGRQRGQIVGRTMSEVLGESAFEVARPHLERALGGEAVGYEAWVDFPHKGRRYMRVAYSPRQTPGGRVEGVHAQIEDETDDRMSREALATAKASLENANERLERLASTDDLTSLKNARTFRERLVEECAEALRLDRELALAIIDVDRFKEYNDAFGHPAGDEALRQVASMLRAECRTYDVAARYGGEEFALILPSTDIAEAAKVAERVRQRVESAPWTKRSITVSVGVATLTPGPCDPGDLVARADRALYAAKEAGRNRVSTADSV